MGSQLIVNFVRSKAMRVATLIILIAFGIGIIRSVYTLSQKKGIMAERLQVLRDLQAKNRELQQDLVEATSSAFVEAQARNKLGLVREGETIVIMEQGRNQGINNPGKLREVSSWTQWWQLFF